MKYNDALVIMPFYYLVIPNLLYKFKENGIIMSQMTQVVNFMPSICVTDKEMEFAIETLINIVEKYLYVKN